MPISDMSNMIINILVNVQYYIIIAVNDLGKKYIQIKT